MFSSPPKAGAPLRVLVIDDDEVALAAIRDVLEEAGFEVRAMVSPIGATQVIAGDSIHVAVIDLNMPLLRGDRLVSMIRNWDKIRDLPVVLVSGDGPGSLAQIGQQLPGVQVVYKDNLRTGLPAAIVRVTSGKPARLVDANASGSRADAPASTTQRFTRDDVGVAFLKGLPQHAQILLRLWNDLAQRRTQDTRSLLVALSTIRTQAQLCGFSAMTKLTHVIADLAANDLPSKAAHVSAAVVTTLSFLEPLGQEKGGLTAATARLTPHIERLQQLRDRLP